MYQEAIQALENVQALLDSKGHSVVATTVGAQIDSIMFPFKNSNLAINRL